MCQKDGTCKCFEDIDGVSFLGPHCEVKLRDECRTIVGGKSIPGDIAISVHATLLN